MRWKTAAFMVLILFSTCAFVVTSTLPVTVNADPDIDGPSDDFGGGLVQPCDPKPGGPGGPGD